MPNLTNHLPDAPVKYRFNELEPYLNEQVVFTHYEKHYKSYIDKLNNALSTYPQFHRWTFTICFEYLSASWESKTRFG